MKNLLLTLFSTVLMTGLFVAPVVAAGNETPTPTPTIVTTNNNNSGGYGGVICQPSYGNGTSCPTTKIMIDKTVKNPQSGQFEDDLTINDPKYAPGNTVTFNLKVTNTTTNETFNDVSVKDILPTYLTYVSGVTNPQYDNTTKTLTFNAGSFKPGESKTFTINAKLADSGVFPADQGITCDITNKALVTIPNFENQDESRFCVQKPTLGTTPTTKGGQPVFPTPSAKTTPKTGPETFALFALIPSGIGGLILRRKTR